MLGFTGVSGDEKDLQSVGWAGGQMKRCRGLEPEGWKPIEIPRQAWFSWSDLTFLIIIFDLFMQVKGRKEIDVCR